MKESKNKKLDKKLLYLIGAGVVVVGGVYVYYLSSPELHTPNSSAQNSALLPDSIDLHEKNSLKYPKGDLKYKLVAKPVITADETTGWSTYTSREHNFRSSY